MPSGQGPPGHMIITSNKQQTRNAGSNGRNSQLQFPQLSASGPRPGARPRGHGKLLKLLHLVPLLGFPVTSRDVQLSHITRSSSDFLSQDKFQVKLSWKILFRSFLRQYPIRKDLANLNSGSSSQRHRERDWGAQLEANDRL